MKKISYFAMFVAVVTLFASCAKTELAETQTGTQPSGFEALELLINNADKVAVTKNFVEPRTGIAGTLYKPKSSNGTVQEILYTETEPTTLTAGGEFFRTGTFMVGTGDRAGQYTCGPVKSNCMVIGRITVVW